MKGSENDRVPDGSQGPPREIGSEPTAERPARLPAETPVDGLPVVPPVRATVAERNEEPARPSEPPQRPSFLDELLVSRTTVHDVGEAARRLSVAPLGVAESRRVVRHLVLSGLFGLLLALAAALMFAGGALRLLLGILAGACIAALGLFLTLRAVGKVADRFGTRALPGSPWLWLGAVVVLALVGTFAVSVSLWEVTKRPDPTPPSRSVPRAKPPEVPVESKRADVDMKRGVHEKLPRGVLYAPPEFRSADGQFDLVIHFHGNVELVEQSVAAAHVNALVAIINVGDGSGVYTKEMQSPYAFDRLLTTIEERARERLRLANPAVRRIALSAWSAGYGSVLEILTSRSRFDRVDALLLLDTPHAKYVSRSETVYPPSIEIYAAFARRAMTGQKLMIVTHSAIPTEGYPSTTKTTDALLEALSLERRTVSPETASPPPVDLPVAVRAFPSGERNWMQVVNQVKERDFAVYGCTGNDKGDHIAHLAQMSVSVLPALRERWK